MKRIVHYTALISCILLLNSCGVPQADYDTLKEENKKLKQEILKLKKTLNDSDPEDQKKTKSYKKALSKMQEKYDATNSVTWYSDKSSIKVNTKNYIQIYVGKKDKGKTWLGLSINYFTKKDWLLIQRIEIDVDGKTFEIEEEIKGELKKKEESGGKREWIDRIVKQLEIPMLKAIASGKTVKIKFFGKDDVKEMTVTTTEKRSMQNVLKAFYELREL
ncbi:hypothetical protein [Aquimarina sp. I32.4]|uniref:hypothetical protein n=1 Tax=Aquimarina sp. I32.4 TaxID=2053903 RepID=UPI000CDEA7DE|nr:hypothetical protein [Aquimarina sp. I32.4]